jgi:amidophosphoribosyltransferase
MPTLQELVAHDRTVEQIREVIGCDELIYQDVDAMIEAIKKALPKGYAKVDGFDASCFNGHYVTGDVSADVIAGLQAQRNNDNAQESNDDTSRLALPNAVID